MKKNLILLFALLFLFTLLFSLTFVGDYTKDRVGYKLSFLLKKEATSYPETIEKTIEYTSTQDSSLLFSYKNVDFPFTFIVFGDSRGSNFGVRSKIVEQIIKEKPSFVIHTGDMVDYGDEENWKLYDEYEGKIQRSGIPVYPVIGNHEYAVKSESELSEPLSYYFSRFPMLNGRHWYSFECGNTLFVMLDTNMDYKEGSAQYSWLISQLKKNSTFLIVTFHHPPYTKTRHKRDADQFLAELFEKAPEMGFRKPDIVFSGHGHNYERYEKRGIMYVVSGGGGAPPHYVARDPADFYTEPGATYHYIRVKVDKKSMALEMVKLDGNAWRVADTFTLLISGTA